MSRTIDEKVVSLQFENSNFEKNVKTSMSTLEKFQNSLRLDGAEKGIENVERAASKFDMSNMASATTAVSKGFSALEIVAINVLSNIATKAVQAGENLVRSLSVDNILAGYGKYEQKTASVQTLLNSTGKELGEINSYLDTLMRFSDETSYGFSEMAQSLAQLTSSGGDIEKLIPMITGIANATAFAGKGPAEFSRAIYNLNQSYGAGALKYMDWKSLELAGVASKDLKRSFIETAIELGKLNSAGQTTKGTLVDIGNFGETLKENWADTEVMERTFGKFSKYTQMADEMVKAGEFDTYSKAYEALANQYDDIYIRAAKAAQEAKTFKEALDATKDAVSSKWLASFETVFGDYETAKRTWTNLANDLYDIFALPGDSRNNILSGAFKNGYDQLKDLFGEVGIEFNDFDGDFKKFLKKNNYNIDELLKQYGSIGNAIANGAIISKYGDLGSSSLGKVLENYTKDFVSKLNESTEVAGSTADTLQQLQDVFDGIWRGDFGNGSERIDKLTKASIDYATAQKLINKLAEEGHRGGYKLTAGDIEHLSEAELKNLGITKKEANAIKDLAKSLDGASTPLDDILERMNQKSGQILLSETILNLTGTILNLQEVVGNAWNKVFDVNLSDVIYRIVLKIHDFTEGIKNATRESKPLTSIFTALFQALKIVGQGFQLVFEVVKKFVDAGLTILAKLFKDVKIDIDGFATVISEALDKAIEWIRDNNFIIEGVEKASAGLSRIIGYLKDWISKVASLEDVSVFFTGVRDSLASLEHSNFGFDNLINGYQDIVQKIQNGSKNPFENVGQNISNFFLNFGNSFSEFKEQISSGFAGTFDKLKMSEEQIARFRDTIKKTSETLVGLGFGYLAMTAFKNFSEAAGALLKPLTAITNLVSSVSTTFTAISSYINAQTRNIRINNILKIAVAVGIITASLYALSKVGSTGDLWNAIAATAALMGIIWLFSKMMSGIGDFSANSEKVKINLKEMSLLIISLGVSLLIIANALKTLDSIGWKKLLIDAGVAVGLIAALIMSVIALNRFSKGQVQASFWTFIGIAASLYLVALAIQKIDSIKIGNPGKVIAVVAGFIISMIGIAASLRLVDKGTSLLFATFAATIWSFVKAIESLAAIKNGDYFKGILRLIPILIALIAVLTVAKGAAKEGSGFTGAFIIGVAGSVYLIGKAIENLGKLDAGQLIKGGAAAVALFGAIALIGAKVSNIANLNPGNIRTAIGASIIIVTAAASLYIMAGAIMIFKNMDAGGLAKGVATIAALFAAIGVLFELMGHSGLFSGGTDKIKPAQAYQAVQSLAKIALIIGILAASLLVLSLIPTGKLLLAAASMTAIILSLSVMVASLSLLKDWKSMVTIVGGVVVLLGALTGMMYLLTEMPNVDKALMVADSLSRVMLSLGATMVLLAAASTMGASLATIGSSLPVIGIITGVIVAIAGLIAAAEEYGWFNGKVETMLDKIIEVMGKIGALFGNLVGGALGGIANGVTEQLVPAAENLSQFAKSISDFINLEVPESFSQTITSLKDMFVAFGSNVAFIKNTASLAESIEDVKTFVSGYGEALQIMSSSMDGVDIERINAASEAGKMFASLNDSLGTTGDGLFSLFVGKKVSLQDFGKNIKSFGEGLVEFSKEMGSFDATAFDTAIPSIEKLMSLESGLQSEWSLFGWLAGGNNGNKDLSKFASRAKQFGQGMKELSQELVGFDPSSIEAAISVGEAMAALETTLANSWSVMGFFEGGENGTQSLADFGNRIQEFVAGLVNGLNAFNELSTVSSDFVGPIWPPALEAEKAESINKNVDMLISIADKFREFESSLSASGGLLSDTETLTSFGNGITILSRSLNNFATNYPATLPEVDSVKNFLSIAQLLFDFAKLNAVTEEEADTLGMFGGIIDGVATGLSGMFGKVMSFLNGEEGANLGLNAAAIKENIISVFDSKDVTDGVTEAGTEVSTKLLDTMNTTIVSSDNRTSLDTSVEEMGISLVEELDKEEEMQENGENYLQGIMNGMASMEESLYEKARSIANTVSSILRSAWDEHSPSRVAYTIGSYFVEGIVNGFEDMTQPTVDAAESMALQVVDAVSRAMDASTEILEDMYSPTITPVLDTTNFLNGASSINGMLNSAHDYNAVLGIQSARGEFQNGAGFGSPVINVNFTVNNAGRDLSEEDVSAFARQITNEVNIRLGSLLRT